MAKQSVSQSASSSFAAAAASDAVAGNLPPTALSGKYFFRRFGGPALQEVVLIAFLNAAVCVCPLSEPSPGKRRETLQFGKMSRQRPTASNSGAQRAVAQQDEFRKAFDFFDVNQDGYITTEELEMAMTRCGVFPSKLELRLVMTQGDADGNGVITFDEFAQLMETQDSSRHRFDKKQLWEQFKLFDRDNDGYIERDEMLLIVKELSLGRYFPREVVDKLFHEADVDGDGKISFEEFVMAVN